MIFIFRIRNILKKNILSKNKFNITKNTGGIMKKFILSLLILLTSLSFSKNLNKYESKRVFDKTIDYILTGNYTKYKNDKSMKRALGNIGKSEEMLLTLRKFFKNNKYEVIDVNESKDESILKVKVNYNSYEDITNEEYLEFLEKNSIEISKFKFLPLEEMDIIDKLFENYKNRIKLKEEVIEVRMNKSDKLWNISSDFENIKLTDTLIPLSNSFLEFLLNYETQ